MIDLSRNQTIKARVKKSSEKFDAQQILDMINKYKPNSNIPAEFSISGNSQSESDVLTEENEPSSFYVNQSSTPFLKSLESKGK